MPSQTNRLIPTVRIMLLGAPLMLAACTSAFGPYPMPTGYAHHDQTYQAPPGGEPVLKNIEYMEVAKSTEGRCMPCETAVVVKKADHAPAMSFAGDSSFDAAANDLVARLIDGFGKPAEPVYIESAPMVQEAEMKLEQSLRSALQAHGVQNAQVPGAGPFTLNYSINSLSVGDGSRTMVSLTLRGQEGTSHEVSGIYSLFPAVPAMADPMVPPASEPAAVSGEPMPIGPLN